MDLRVTLGRDANKAYNITLDCEPLLTIWDEVFEGADSCGRLCDKTQTLKLF